MSERNLTDWSFAQELDARDTLASFRNEFHIPEMYGKHVVYLCGHSLGLLPRNARLYTEAEFLDWEQLGVDAHFKGKNPWYSYHEWFAGPLSRLVGAQPNEVVAMNSLTVNLHLMLTSFYRPAPERHAILIDEPTFPSDRYALESQIRLHGYHPTTSLLSAEDIEEAIKARGDEISVVIVNAVNFLTGRFYDVWKIVRLTREHGCILGLDLAHAIGNVPLQLHDWGVDFAVWCSYKYLNGGPGTVGGCFVHERHGERTDRPRLAGWWGNDPATRFRMHLEPHFIPKPGADGWQISNPPILAMAPLRASLELFDRAGIDNLREKSLKLTQYLETLLDRLPPGVMTQLTPRVPDHRGSMLALEVHDRPRELFEELERQGIVCDFREPNVIRVTPCPLYNSFHDVWCFAQALSGRGSRA
jgi:kynureninase